VTPHSPSTPIIAICGTGIVIERRAVVVFDPVKLVGLVQNRLDEEAAVPRKRAERGDVGCHTLLIPLIWVAGVEQAVVDRLGLLR
jgi:hypothetical protein